METSDTSTWRVELVNKFSINDAEDNTKTAFTTGKTVLKETETKIQKLVNVIRVQLKPNGRESQIEEIDTVKNPPLPTTNQI